MAIFTRRNIRYFISYILLLSLPLVLMPEPVWLVAQQMEEGEKLLEEGIKAYKEGDFDIALVKLEKALLFLKAKEKLTEGYYYLSLSYFAFRRTEKVKQNLIEMFKLNPKKEPDYDLCPPDFITIWEEAKKDTLASLLIETRPAEAEVYLDEELVGRSPIKLSDILPGEHKLRVIKAGFESKDEHITLAAGAEKEFYFELKKEVVEERPEEIKETLSSLIIKTSPAGASVFLDGELVGRSPIKLSDILPGEHKLRIIKADYAVKDELITLAAGVEKEFSFELKREAEEKKPEIAVTPPEKKTEVKKGNRWLWILIGGAAAVVTVLLLAKGGKKTTTTTATTTTAGGNQRPKMQDLQGPTLCIWGNKVEYKASGNDPDGNRVAINFWIKQIKSGQEWEIGWSNFVNNNTWVKVSVIWNKNKYSCGSDKCQFRIRAKCKDEQGRESDPLRLDVWAAPPGTIVPTTTTTIPKTTTTALTTSTTTTAESTTTITTTSTTSTTSTTTTTNNIADLRFCYFTKNDSNGDSDGKCEPGERIIIGLAMKNVGGAPADNVEAIMNYVSGPHTQQKTTEGFGKIDNNGSCVYRSTSFITDIWSSATPGQKCVMSILARWQGHPSWADIATIEITVE